MIAARSTAAATADDLARLTSNVRAEVIGGHVVERVSPTFEHSTAQAGIGIEIGRRFHRRGGGGRNPGGWWIATEVEVEYGTHEVYLHDLAGWKRERVLVRPTGRPIRIRPDWVCEVLSPSNAKNDLVDKFNVLRDAKVPHYWVVDPAERVLTVYRSEPNGYLAILTAGNHDKVRAEPFEALEFSLGVFWGDEDPSED